MARSTRVLACLFLGGLLAQASLGAAGLQGRVLRLGSSQPVPYAEVYTRASGLSGTPEEAWNPAGTADSRGKFSFNLPPGPWQVRASASGFVPSDPLSLAVPATGTVSADLALRARNFEAEELLVKAKRGLPQPSQQELSGAESRRVAGGASDPLRAVSRLPGSQIANDFLAVLMVRGSGYQDNLILLDGFPATYPFHFGGVESVFHPGMLSDVRFLPGGFDATYGDLQGGVLDLQTRQSEPGIHGEAGASLIQAGALASYSPGEAEGSVAGSYRRGYFDLVLKPSGDFTGFPRYQDYLAQVRAPVGDQGQLELMAFGSDDQLDVLTSAAGGASALGGWRSYFHTLGAKWNQPLGDGLALTLLSSATISRQYVSLGPDLNLDEKPYEWYVHSQADWLWGKNHQMQAGGEFHETRTELKGHFARIPAELGSGFDYPSLQVADVDALGSKTVLSGWVQDRWKMIPELTISLGGRFDWLDLYKEYYFAPRLSAQYDWDERTRWIAYAGDYFQSPTGLETVPGWTGGLLRSGFTRQWGFSVEKKPVPDLSLKAEYFHKIFSRFVSPVVVEVGTNTVDAKANTEVVANSTATGFADGVELTLSLRPKGSGFFGWAGYAYTFTEKSLGFGLPLYEADFSQPHTFNLVGNFTPAPAWELGAAFKLASGIPYTPVALRSKDVATGRWVPVFGPPNSERLDWYNRLDLRVQYSFFFTGWTLRLYYEMLNAMDQPNVTSVTYNDDYSGIREIRQFPRIHFGGLELLF